MPFLSWIIFIDLLQICPWAVVAFRYLHAPEDALVLSSWRTCTKKAQRNALSFNLSAEREEITLLLHPFAFWCRKPLQMVEQVILPDLTFHQTFRKTTCFNAIFSSRCIFYEWKMHRNILLIITTLPLSTLRGWLLNKWSLGYSGRILLLFQCR